MFSLFIIIQLDVFLAHQSSKICDHVPEPVLQLDDGMIEQVPVVDDTKVRATVSGVHDDGIEIAR